MYKLQNKFAIGCLVQWYEIEILEEYVQSVRNALDIIDRWHRKNVIVHFTLVTNQQLEKINDEVSMKDIEKRFIDIMKKDAKPQRKCFRYDIKDSLHTIADYRREFNERFCQEADVLMWGETDSLIPRQTFQILDNLHNNVKDSTPKYVSFFGTCKMWDESWKVVEHTDFTDKPHIDNDYDNWWSLKYTMSLDEMYDINSKVEDLDVQVLDQHKFNGCGLVISSDVIKSGVNIPRSVFFVHEDTAFMMMIRKVLGNIPQYQIKNILLVHNRNHPKKRMYVSGERLDGTMNEKRRSNDWYVKANKMSEQNTYSLFNNQRIFTWDDVFK
jgi:hypothetical protein|tara:strand:+ start:107 stop:1087 length:981 start_codon:yes stop_codon:yes gene_type:complete